MILVVLVGDMAEVVAGTLGVEELLLALGITVACAVEDKTTGVVSPAVLTAGTGVVAELARGAVATDEVTTVIAGVSTVDTATVEGLVWNTVAA